jgi:hypothetical protein
MFAVTMMLRWQIFTTQEAHAAVQVAAKRLGVSPGECVSAHRADGLGDRRSAATA